MQLVNLTEGGERVQMSKRAGDVRHARRPARRHRRGRRALVPASQRSHDTTLDLDLELARSQSQDNPVYYVQYAHARIASHPAQGGGGAGGSRRSRADLARELRAVPPSARALRQAAARAARPRSATRPSAARRTAITAYATRPRQDFSAFYRDCRVVGAAEEGGDEDVRIAICVLAKRVLAQSLDLLGVERAGADVATRAACARRHGPAWPGGRPRGRSGGRRTRSSSRTPAPCR